MSHWQEKSFRDKSLVPRVFSARQKIYDLELSTPLFTLLIFEGPGTHNMHRCMQVLLP